MIDNAVAVAPGSTYLKPLTVFVSYSHKDAKLFSRLKEHLSSLSRQGLVGLWSDQELHAGSEFNSEILEQVNKADVILLLITASFIASDYCYCIEMKRAIERHNKGAARVIPIILKPCDWHDAPFGKLLALPTEGRPVTLWRNREAALTDVAKGVKQALYELTPVRSDEIAESRPDNHGLSAQQDFDLGLISRGEGLDALSLVIRNLGNSSFTNLDVVFAIPEKAGDGVDVFQTAGGGVFGRVDPGYGIEFPPPPKLMEYIIAKNVGIGEKDQLFLSQLQVLVEAEAEGYKDRLMWLYRFQLTPLDSGSWVLERTLKTRIFDKRRIILHPTDGRAALFGGEFYLEPKYSEPGA